MSTLTFDPKTLAPVIESDEEPKSLELAQRGLFSGLGTARFGGIPVGEALIGGASATLVSEMISGLLGGGVMGGVLKLIAGNALAGVFSGMLGRGATDAARLFLTYDAIRDLVPIDTWVQEIVGGVSGLGVGGNAIAASQSQGGINTGNGSVAALDSWLRG